MKEGNKERVYLSDWLYNAGILGFLKINSDLFDIETVGDKKEVKSKDENMLKIGENYIEFDRKIFKDFSKRFFDFAFNQLGRYDRNLKFLDELIETLKDKEKFNYVYDRFKNLLTNYSRLKKKLGNIPPKKDFQGKEEQLKSLIEKAIEIIKEDREFWESEVQIYLQKIYGQKSFLNKSVNKDRFKKFYEDFEVPLTENKVKKDEKYYCISCNERKAKKDSIFDTGISKFYGLNPDAVNFAWNFNSKLPLCEICEIVYFSYFAAFTPMKKGDKTVYYFVNSDSSIYDLIVDNLLLEKSLNKENPLLEFFTELILESSYREAVFTLQNIQILEIDLSEEVMPKIYSFNLSREKAEFLKKEKESLKELSKNYYKIKDAKISILPEVVSMILGNKLYYNYLNKILRFFLSKKGGSKNYETNISPYKIQILTFIISKFIKDVLGGKTMEVTEKEMWNIYYEGKKLATVLKSKNAENKIQSISYKLLNSLRVGDYTKFMDILLRVYIAYGEEIPSSFVKVLGNSENFYSLGYSFLNGLLSNLENNQQQEVTNDE